MVFILDTITSQFTSDAYREIEITIPRLAVLGTGVFDQLVKRNGLDSLDFDRLSDDRIALAFMQADLPAEIVGDLRALIASVNTPLAIRSSSMLEDAMYEPFAGVYATKMIPNNQPDVDVRFHKLVEAIKFVYASTFFRGAREYHAVAGRSTHEEKMAVIIQEVVGRRHGDRFYPDVSGVARSHNFYPTGDARPEEGVVNLALGLGKTIVDGGVSWSYSPANPRANPPVSSPRELLRQTQTSFWAINMGKAPAHDPIRETEYLCQGSLADAEFDGTLYFVASTYRAEDDRLVIGTGSTGPRVLTFARLLAGWDLPLNDLICDVLKRCEEAVDNEVEIEFAVTLNPQKALPARFGFLQVRPMVVSSEQVEVTPEEMSGPNVLAASEKVLGNGIVEGLEDIVYVKPDGFQAKHTRAVAEELSIVNRCLAADGRTYVLIGFGRWGSSDPWLGIPVEWGQISGARVLLEATLPDMNVELSQGSHFFHNLTSFQVLYFSVQHDGKYRIDWPWLKAQPAAMDLEYVRHVHLDKPLTAKVDGHRMRGVLLV